MNRKTVMTTWLLLESRREGRGEKKEKGRSQEEEHKKRSAGHRRRGLKSWVAFGQPYVVKQPHMHTLRSKNSVGWPLQPPKYGHQDLFQFPEGEINDHPTFAIKFWFGCGKEIICEQRWNGYTAIYTCWSIEKEKRIIFITSAKGRG